MVPMLALRDCQLELLHLHPRMAFRQAH